MQISNGSFNRVSKSHMDKKMKRNLPFTFLVFFLAVFSGIISCNRDKSIINARSETAIDDFPNEIGNEWTYFYYDSLIFYSDTVRVKIVDEIEFDGGRKAKIWEYYFKTKIE